MPKPREPGRPDTAERLLHDALDLIAQARRLDDEAMDPSALFTDHAMTRSATPRLWRQDAYERDLADFESRVKTFLGKASGMPFDPASVREEGREAGVEEVAANYHEAIARDFRKLARETDLPGVADDHERTARRHETYASEIRQRVWESGGRTP